MQSDELRFGFGRNWADFVERNLNETTLRSSQEHLAGFLRLPSLKGLTFLDIGCGSGLHSFAAYRLGADRIISFDYDKDSVSTTQHLRHRAGDPANWTVMQGSVLDKAFMESLPKADVVYSWGVLHHTGDMWGAVCNAAIPMKPDAVFYIALYSSDNYVDPPPEFWLKVKRKYNRLGPFGRRMMEWWYVYRFHVRPAMKAGQNPLQVIRNYGGRGMTFWTDAKDWLGGYPMDFAGLKETIEFCGRKLGLEIADIRTGEGCTEYLFCRSTLNTQWHRIVEARKLITLAGPFAMQGGACYSTPLPQLASQADSVSDQHRSNLMVYEDGQPLGLRHSLHDDIRKYGKGRFSHWDANLYFSSTDNSDPNTNGRTYAYCEVF
jgi:SAM-dependent methyltransferase